MQTVTFCGHSLLPDKEEVIYTQLRKEIEKLIQQGAKIFLLGGYGDFDKLCAKTVKKMKERYPHIRSILVVPYMNRKWNPETYDQAEYPPLEKVPPRFAIIKRNQYMVDQADVVVACVKYSWGGALKTLEYAEKKNKQIIRISPD